MAEVAIPEVLKKFSEDLIAKQRSYVSINATALDCELDKDPLDIKRSKFLGVPFVPEGMEYPTDECGDPLVLIAQINFSEVPLLEGFPDEGILQLYFKTKDWWDMSGEEKFIFITGTEANKPQRNDLPLIDNDMYKELPVWKIHKLEFVKAIDTGNSEDCQFSFDFDGKDYWDFEESLSGKHKEAFESYFTNEGHKIGGYADFTQGDPRDYECDQQHDVQILQIDVDDEIMFGDSGIGHIFISPEHLKNREFEKSYFYWDCC